MKLTTRIIVLEEGKYEIHRLSDGRMAAMRHGEPWRDLTGDKLVGALLDRIETLEPDVRTIAR